MSTSVAIKTSAPVQRSSALFAGTLAALVLGCARERDGERSVVLSDPRAQSAAAAASAQMIENVFALSADTLHATAGQLALVPSAGSLRESLHSDERWVRLTYTRALLDEIGARTTRVRWISQQRGVVTNGVIIPLPSRQAARRGDVVLTSGASNVGLLRALVVSDVVSETPRVLSLDEPASKADARILERGTFVTLQDDARAGVTLACSVDGRLQPFVLGAASAGRVLAVGFAGQSRTFAESECRRLPLAPALREGELVLVPVVGNYLRAVVKEPEAEDGRVLVSYEFAGEQRQARLGRINVARDLAR